MKVMIGKIYMKSGNVIPFAAEELTWKKTFEGLHEVTSTFVSYKDIPIVCFIAWSEVESIVTEKEEEIEETVLGEVI